MVNAKENGGVSHQQPDTAFTQLLREQVHAEVQERFGVMPNFFSLPPENPEITANLFGFATFAYLDNPLPALFKERLFVYLSRFCDVRYCIVRHVGFLTGLGNPAGDPQSPVNLAEEVIRLVTRPLPRAESLEPFIARLYALDAALSSMPSAESALEEAIFACATHTFLQTQSAAQCLAALRHALDESAFQYLLVFLMFTRTAHYWTQVQPDLQLEDDVRQMLAVHERLAKALLDDPAALTSRIGQALIAELEFLRGEHQRSSALLRSHQARMEATDQLLHTRSVDLGKRVAELESVNAEIRASRRAALNLTEDAILSKEALRTNDARMRAQKEAFQAAVNGAPLEESLNILARMVADETKGAARTAFYLADQAGISLHPVVGVGSMPEAYLQQMNGFRIGEDSPACGLAVSTDQPVLTHDVFDDLLWKPWLHLAEQYEYRGCWSFPIKTRAHKAVGIFAMYFHTPRTATPHDCVLAEVVTQSAAVIINNHIVIGARAHAEAALRESEAKYRTLFESIDEGVAIVEVFPDEHGRVADMVWHEANQGVKRHTGTDGWVGKRASEIVPTLEQEWLDAMTGVYQTGEPVRTEAYIADLDRWIDTYYSRVGGPSSPFIASVFQDITERKRRELNTALLNDISKDLTLLFTPDEIMAKVGARVGEALQLSGCVFSDVNEKKGENTVYHAWNTLGVPSLKQTFRIMDYVGAEFMRAGHAGEHFIVRDTQHDGRVDAVNYARLNIGSFIIVPFHWQGEWTWFFAALAIEPRDWQADDIDTLQEISVRVFSRIERARAEEALQQANDALEQRVQERTAELATSNTLLQQEVVERRQIEVERTALLQRVITAQEDERLAISRELHDGLGQFLAALTIRMAILESHATHAPDLLADIRNLHTVARNLDRELDRLTIQLRPPALSDLGLAEALRTYSEDWTRSSGVPVDVLIQDVAVALPASVEANVYRIVQEALTNIFKHAQATEVGIILTQRRNQLRVIVEDNGVGFDVDAVRANAQDGYHVGLLSMQERATLLGGTLSFDSAPGSGTTIYVTVPLPNAAT